MVAAARGLLAGAWLRMAGDPGGPTRGHTVQSSYCVNLNAVEGYANMFQADQRKCWRDLNLTGTKPLADEQGMKAMFARYLP